MHVFETLLPVFIIIGIGFGLRKSDFFSNDFVDGLSKLIYWLALPSLLFYKIAIASYDYKIVGKTACVLTIGMAASMIVGYIAAHFMKLKGPTLGSFVQGTIRANIMYIGLPILLYYYANAAAADRVKVEALSILVMAPMIPVYNILSVVVLLASQHKFNGKAFGLMGYKIVTNPMIIASVAGFVYSLLFSSMPIVADRVLSAVSESSLPLALLTVGAAMAQSKDTNGWGQATISSLIKIVISPAAGFFAAKLLGLGQIETMIAMIYLACPTATASYILADQLNGDRKLAASIVVICTLLSIVSLSVVVWLF
jgi:malate permease and related proteins